MKKYLQLFLVAWVVTKMYVPWGSTGDLKKILDSLSEYQTDKMRVMTAGEWITIMYPEERSRK